MKRLFFTLLVALASISVWADNSVTVTYNGTTATVSVDENIAQYLTVTQSGAHVSVAQSADVTEEITYTLTGSSTDGEFYMSGSFKATVELNGLTLTNTTPVYSGAAIHIQNSKRINVKVITGTVNTLTDAANGDQKGCLYVKGHAEFKQYGTLNIVGNVKHGIKAGEYVSIKNATINITSAVGDGISCNQYFLMESGTLNISDTGDDGLQCDLDGETSTGITTNHEDEDTGNIYITGGTITINCPAIAAKGITCMGDIYISESPVIDVTTTGKGMWDTEDLETKTACGISADGNIDISGGTITLTATGSGGKGMKCDNVMTISGGNITVATSGGLYYNNGSYENTNYTANTDEVNNSYYSSPKGIKAGTKTEVGSNSYTYSGGITISGGTISVTTQGNNAEGIESKNYFNITGGQITVDAYDDGLNSAQDMTVSNGYVYARSVHNDGMDANGNMYIEGGLIYAIGSSTPEVAIDANTEENKKFYFTGGTLIAIGGLERGSALSQTCYQSSSWSQNTWYSLTFGSNVIAFKTPSSGGSTLVVSASSTPSVKSGVTVTGGTSIFEGKCYLDATISGGSSVNLSEYTGGGGGGNPPGPGGNSYTITATANPTAGGIVTGGGTYNRYATCTLTATPNTGYTFTNWTRNGSVVSTNATYSFQVTGNASFVANFTLNSYTVTASANPAEGGTITGAGTYNHGSTVSLTATANEGYVFTNWTENGQEVSNQATYSFVITGNKSLVANFEESHPEGPYLVVDSYTPDSAPFDQETYLSLSLKNVGADPTGGITSVSLSCEDRRLDITNDMAEIAVLPANETVTIQDVFSFVIAEAVEDGTEFQIDVEMICGDATWTGQVTITADVAVLTYQNMEWTGGFTPGETLTLIAKFKNTGHFQAVNVLAEMTSTSDYVTVGNSSIDVGVIEVDQVISLNFPLTIAANCPQSAVIPVTFTLTADGGLMAQGNETLSNTEEIVIGDGTATDQYLPSYSYYNYTLSQQLYTVDELGAAGVITSIAFYNGGTEKTRSYDFYMKNTTKSTFSGSTDWETVTAADKVFSGNVTMVADDWTHIILDEPFIYDGESNVVLVADDNTGSYSNSPHLTCRVFNATSQALRVYSDGTNYNPLAPASYNGTVMNVKNQLLLVKEMGAGCSKPKDLTVTEVGPNYANLSWTGSSSSYLVQVGCPAFLTSENFDETIPADWTNDATYPWTFVDGYIQSGNAGVVSSTSSISVTVNYPTNGTISFDFWSRGEGTDSQDYDNSRFYIDNVQQFRYGAHNDWESFSTEVTAGTHTFKWEYKKDNYVDPTGDCFIIDNVVMKSSETSWFDPVAFDDVECTVTGLMPETTYCVRVQGICDGIESKWSEEVYFTTTELTTQTQTVSLAAGANYVSFNVATTLADLQTALTDALGTTGVTMSIKSQTEYTELKRGKWTTGFNNFNVSEMFIVKVSDACEISLTGAPIDAAAQTITMVPGANWIAYPLSLPMTITNAFTGFVGTNDALTSQTQYSKYTRGKWSTEIELQPGQGYIYGSAAMGDRLFTFPVSK